MDEEKVYMSLTFTDIELTKALQIRDAVMEMGGAVNFQAYFDEPIESDTQPDE